MTSSPDSVETATSVSFVVPTKNSARTIAACLRSLKVQKGPPIEVIVVDNHSSDGTDSIAAELADKVISAGPERSAQRNVGAREASGQFLAFIDSDMVLQPLVAQGIVEQFEDPQVHALVIPEKAVGTGFWDRCRQLEKEAYLGDRSVEAARAFRRATFLEAGGYDESLTGPEDWELPDRLARTGYRIGRISAFALHDEETLGLWWVFKKKRYYGKSFSKFLGSSSGPRYRFLRLSLLKPLRRVLSNPLLVAGVYLLKLAEAAGLAVGLLEGLFKKRRG